MDIALESKEPDFQMKLSLVISILVAASVVAYAESPRITAVDPQNGKAGDVITVTGENLQKDSVAKLYLTDGTNDIQVDEITEQTATSIKFKIPAKAKPGRLALMFLTAGKIGQLMEQPYKITIDEP
jgi:hypothetical protein